MRRIVNSADPDNTDLQTNVLVLCDIRLLKLHGSLASAVQNRSLLHIRDKSCRESARAYISPMKLTVRVTPRAGRDAIQGWDSEGRLAIRVAAAPTDGAANAAVARLLARTLGLPGRDVTLVAGAASRIKVFELPLDRSEIDRRLAGSPES
jgi:uncharacterized protein YggU (UPF0235/DUF167 family)